MDDSYEDIENVTGYVISGQDNTLTVNVEDCMPVVFNYEFVFSVRYIEEETDTEDEETEQEFDVSFKNVNLNSEQFTKMMKRLFDGII